MITLAFYQWQAQWAPECGGNLCSLAYNGFELLRKPPNLDTLRQTPELYGIPVLFPPNRIENGEFTFAGQRYRLPLNEPARNNHLHGLALHVEWLISGPCEARFYHRATKDYPAEFELRLKYEFQPEQVVQVLTVINHGNEPMPCGIGFHTVFNAPVRLRLDAAECYREVLPPRYLPTGRLLPWEGFNPNHWFSPGEQALSRQFQATPGVHAAELDYGQLWLRYEVDPKFTEWCLWNGGKDSGFICPEPMSWMTNAPNLVDDISQLGGCQTQEFISLIIVGVQYKSKFSDKARIL